MRKHLALVATAGAFLLSGVVAIGATPAPQGFRQTIYVRNVSTVFSDAKLRTQIPAYQAGISKDFAPVWGTDIKLVFIGRQAAPAGAWTITVSDDSNDLRALAYHNTVNGVPAASVFARTLQNAHVPVSLGFDHELEEMLADPYIDRQEQNISDSRIWALEVSDPVESQKFAYTRKGSDGKPVILSDFVTPRWFGADDSTQPFDFTKHITSAEQVLDGGYAQFWNGYGWTQVYGPGAFQWRG